MWFAAALLAFCLMYAAYEGLRRRRSSRPPRSRPPRSRPLRLRSLALAVLAIALSSFGTWTLWPMNEDAYLNLRFAEWPQGAVLFALGVHAAHGGWLPSLSRHWQRLSGWVAVTASVAILGLIAAVIEPDEEDKLVTRADPPTLAFALLDGVIAVAFTLWSLAWLQRRRPTHGPLVGKAARGSFATYFIHPLVLTAIMVLVAPRCRSSPR